MKHTPVLLHEVIESLQLKSGMNVIDCTVGDAGHAEKILAATAPNGRLLAIDADPESILRAKQFLHDFGERVIYARDNFIRLKEIIKEHNFGPVDGILLDLGWSTPQFEERHRGFSFLKEEEPLDMRYNPKMQNAECSLPRTTCPDCSVGKHRGMQNYENAAQILNQATVGELEKIFREYGEEKLAREMARAIGKKREESMIETVGDLVEIILAVYRQKLKSKKEVPWVGGLHPATRVFQALRIAVNDELGAVKKVLPQAIEVLAPGGRLAVITFHSLEDRIVKHFFKKNDQKILMVVTKRPIVPGGDAIHRNPRARSAKLRVAQKI